MNNPTLAPATHPSQQARLFMQKVPTLCSRSNCLQLLMMALIGLLVLTPQLAAQDLPFDSGSTGADGPLAFKAIPGGRNSHAMAYDPVRQQVVVHGGWNGGLLGDTWVLSGGDWTRAFTPVAPTGRYQHRMVWDGARSEIVLFGGLISGGSVYLNDTWVWNGESWAQKSPANSPSPRADFTLAYDAAREQVVLFGGTSSAATTRETWLWDGTNWTQADPATVPDTTSGNAMLYDVAREVVLLHGNWSQTWTWDGTDWTRQSSFQFPSNRGHPAMAYDPIREVAIFNGGGGLRETWSWDGSGWTKLDPHGPLLGTQLHAMVWDDARQRIVLFGGTVHGTEQGIEHYSADTWLWDGTIWSFWSGKAQIFDMTERPDGIWNFTTIDVPTDVTVRFKKNAGNTPVRWLATEEVIIHGVLDLNGDRGVHNLPVGTVARGGPGGFDGGRGAVRVDVSGSSIGSPGQGPGGGQPGTELNPTSLRDGQPGQHREMYGNVFLQPLLGGSGGGGGASSDTLNGGNGGGGGGAILIASSRDIFFDGSIQANGGDQGQFSGSSNGGRGSGGAILLRADRVIGNGTLQAVGGTSSSPNGRIRVEAYILVLNGTQTPPAVASLPAPNGELNIVGNLTIVSVDGANVSQPPSGGLQTPDVVFSETGPVDVVVSATGIPDGTPITLRVVTSDSVILAGPANLADGSASFAVTVPKGLGTLQAIAEFSR